MHVRYAFDYFAPTTLVAVINDQMNSAISPDTRTIVGAAYDALISNTGEDEANEMLLKAGIGYEELAAYNG